MFTFIGYAILTYLIFSYSFGLWYLRQDTGKNCYIVADTILSTIFIHITFPLWTPFALIQVLNLKESIIKFFCLIYNIKHES